MSRKRNPSVIEQQRQWLAHHAAYLARGNAKLPPQPDPKTHPKEFHAWMRDNARAELSPEGKKVFSELKALPVIKLRRPRDIARSNMIRWLIRFQKRRNRPVQDPDLPDYDLMTCKLGQYPGPGTDGKGSKQLQGLLMILAACSQPSITPGQLYDSIREWRKRRREMSPPSP